MSEKELEGTNVVEMGYSTDSYRPAGYSVNGESANVDETYFKYDAAGNVWYDRRAKSVYRLNAAGLPEIVYILIGEQDGLTLDQVNAGDVTDVAETMRMAYDEGGNRIWTGFKGAGIDYEMAEMPGVGTYEWTHIGSGATGFSLKRMDLVAGGFRDMRSGVAYFPVTDAQGNVRGYATTAGLQSAYDYYAYGTAEEIVRGTDDDNRRWQGKEYDEPIRKLYFGARYFDPFFGMWMSPDPAGQFANPYTYGGDPMNYVDPNGEFVLTAVVVGAAVGALIGATMGAVQCTSPGGGGSCGKTVGMNAGTGFAVGVMSGVSGGAFAGTGIIASIAGGAIGGAVGGVTGQLIGNIVDDDRKWYSGFGSAAWEGALTGAIGGGVGFGAAQLWGRGALSALTGGFAGGATGSALNGEKNWNILVGGLMGAGSALASYSVTWGVENYGGAEVPCFDSDGEPLDVPKKPNGSFEAEDYLKQANKILVDARSEYARNNGLNAEEIEAGASFKIKTKFWTGEKYLEHGEIGFGKTSVRFISRKNDDFRMHLHPKDGTAVSAGSFTDSRHPSPVDYTNERGYARWNIKSYIGYNDQGITELYRYTYTNKNSQYLQATW